MEETTNYFPLLRSVFLCIPHMRISSMYSWTGFLLVSGLYANIFSTGSWEYKDARKASFSYCYKHKGFFIFYL